MPTTLMIVEDEGLLRDLLRSSLSHQPGLTVVECVGDGTSAVRVARELKPDVVLMDIELGDGINGIEAGCYIKRESPSTGIVLLSSHMEKQYITCIPLEEAAGWCYMSKQSVSHLPALTRAIEGAAAGLSVMDPVLIKALRPRPSSIIDRLTPRQLEILALIAQGYSNTAIAEELTLGQKSVENYINTLYQNLHITRDEPIHPRVKATLTYLRETRAA